MTNFVTPIVIIFIFFLMLTANFSIPKPHKFSKAHYYNNIAISLITFFVFLILSDGCEPCPLTHESDYISNHLATDLLNLHTLSFNVNDFLLSLDHVKDQVDYTKILDIQTGIKDQIKDTTELQQKIIKHKCFQTEYGTLFYYIGFISFFLVLYSGP